MYAIYAYIGVVLGVNVSIYGIHGVSGLGTLKKLVYNPSVDSSVFIDRRDRVRLAQQPRLAQPSEFRARSNCG